MKTAFINNGLGLMGVGKYFSIILLSVLIIAPLFFFSGCSSVDEEAELTKNFEAFSDARATGALSEIAPLVSPGFKDGGLSYRDALRSFSTKRPGYSVSIINLNIAEDIGEISYKRTEMVNGKKATVTILNEKWRKGSEGWQIYRFSKADRVAIKATISPEASTAAALESIADLSSVVTGKSLKKGESEDADKGKEEKKKKKKVENKIIVLSEEEVVKHKKEVEKVLSSRYLQALDIYSSEGKRDPFKSLIAGFGNYAEGVSVKGKKRCDAGRRRTFLEGFDLYSLSLVGIIVGRNNVALVETANGTGYTVKTGMRIGKHCGKVVGISASRILVTEKIFNLRKGKLLPVKREIKLKTRE